jgi:tetratricopeptide (TPR) repeat protein
MDLVTTSELQPPDSHHLNAAVGWIELGNVTEAKVELARIPASGRNHPDVLEAEWRIHAAERDWPAALDAARVLVNSDSDNPSGWIHQSYSLHELNQTREALDLLLPVAEKFSSISTIPYNLACYACQLGNLEEARRWLGKAIKIRGKNDIKQMALTDPDLQPMWGEIKGL